jgi:FkbM family methyltransferase
VDAGMSLQSRSIKLVRALTRRFGVEVGRFDPNQSVDRRRQRILEERKLEMLLDVGANVGQYGARMREFGYRGELLSFEPLADAFAQLKQRADKDGRWRCVKSAVGDREGEIAIHVAANSYSSSALPILERHLASAPDSVTQRVEKVPLHTLDTLVAEAGVTGRRTFLKVDVQGFEKQVVLGADKALQNVYALESELSLVPLYAGQALLAEMIELFAARGFRPVSIEPGFADRATGELLQVDGIFIRV